MALKNTTVAANIRHGKHGGSRRNSGRTLGAKDTVPRKGSEKSRFQALQAELGKAYKRIEALENELQYGAKFTGDNMRELLLAHARGEYNATHSQLYAAKALYDREPPAVDSEKRELDADENRKWIINQLGKLEHETHREWDAQLREWIAAGKLHEDCALLCRSQWAEEGDAPWESGQAADTGPPLRIQHTVIKRQNSALVTNETVAPERPQPAPAPNGHAPVQRVRLMYTHPGQRYVTLAGKRYEADNGGELVVDEADVAELRSRLGARDRR